MEGAGGWETAKRTTPVRNYYPVKSCKPWLRTITGLRRIKGTILDQSEQRVDDYFPCLFLHEESFPVYIRTTNEDYLVGEKGLCRG